MSVKTERAGKRKVQKPKAKASAAEGKMGAATPAGARVRRRPWVFVAITVVMALWLGYLLVLYLTTVRGRTLP
jgi:hypothetical protein